jgi:hypothetical protein
MPFLFCARGELAEQPALSDPGFTRNQNEAALAQTALAQTALAQCGHQGEHLCVATDEDGANVHVVILAAM